MRKSTIAAFTAAALVGFGAVGSANAADVSGFADINWDVQSVSDEDGHFRASGEFDIVEKGDSVTFRGDFDLNNCHNGSPPVDLPTGTDPGLDVFGVGGSVGCGVGVDVEQLRADIPVNGMATVSAGIMNGFHGMEGQDATDIPFAYNGLLWLWVPSNMAGGMVEVTPTDMVTVRAAFINQWLDLAQVTDTANDVMAGVSVMPVEGLAINASYLTDETETIGDEVDVNVILDMVENLSIGAEYLMADPATGTGNLDNGYGITAAYVVGDITVAGRYEATTYEGAAPDITASSVAVGYNLDAQTVVRLDYSNFSIDSSTLSPAVDKTDDFWTVQLVHTFDGMGAM